MLRSLLVARHSFRSKTRDKSRATSYGELNNIATESVQNTDSVAIYVPRRLFVQHENRFTGTGNLLHRADLRQLKERVVERIHIKFGLSDR